MGVAVIELPGCRTLGTRRSWATVSECGRYRYALGRAWDDTRPIFSIVMLNPSTADHELNDPTIRKVIHFAKQEGCGSLLVRNLFAWRATKPHELRLVADPHGPQNEAALDRRIVFGLRVAAWGALTPKWLQRVAVRPVAQVKRDPGLHVLGLTEATGDPRHPLFLRNETRAERWADVIARRQR